MVQSGIREQESLDLGQTARSTIIKQGESPQTTIRQTTDPRIVRSPHTITPQRRKEEESEDKK